MCDPSMAARVAVRDDQKLGVVLFMCIAIHPAISMPAVCQSLSLGPVFGDNMVFQAGAPVVIWGYAQPMATVGVQVGGFVQFATTGDQRGVDEGLWRASVPEGVLRLRIAENHRTAGPDNRLRLPTIVVQLMDAQCDSHPLLLFGIELGDVLMCSGQSNMDRAVRLSGEAVIPNANVRLFTHQPAATGPYWGIASSVLLVADFSAVCWFAATTLSDNTIRDTNGTGFVGAVDVSIGGSAIVDWLPRLGVHWRNTLSVFEVGPTQFKAVVWYQGESDVVAITRDATANSQAQLRHRGSSSAGDGFDGETVAAYRDLLSRLVTSWRVFCLQEHLQFVVVEIAPCTCYDSNTNGAKVSAGVRQAQQDVITDINGTAFIPTADLPVTPPNNIHPTNKKQVGRRVAQVLRDNLFNSSIAVRRGGPVAWGVSNQRVGRRGTPGTNDSRITCSNIVPVTDWDDTSIRIVAVRLNGCGRRGCVFRRSRLYPLLDNERLFSVLVVVGTVHMTRVWRTPTTVGLCSDNTTIIMSIRIYPHPGDTARITATAYNRLAFPEPVLFGDSGLPAGGWCLDVDNERPCYTWEPAWKTPSTREPSGWNALFVAISVIVALIVCLMCFLVSTAWRQRKREAYSSVST